MSITAPHFAMPFSASNGVVAQVEQDSVEEIEDCVEAVLRTPQGSRVEEPEFGIPDASFEQLGPNPSAEAYLAALAEWEPRAHMLGEARLGELGTVNVTIKSEAA
jgi:phage baseplate assembly protein W